MGFRFGAGMCPGGLHLETTSKRSLVVVLHWQLKTENEIALFRELRRRLQAVTPGDTSTRQLYLLLEKHQELQHAAQADWVKPLIDDLDVRLEPLDIMSFESFVAFYVKTRDTCMTPSGDFAEHVKAKIAAVYPEMLRQDMPFDDVVDWLMRHLNLHWAYRNKLLDLLEEIDSKNK